MASGDMLVQQLGVLCRRQIPFRGQQQQAAPHRGIRTASIIPQAASGYHQFADLPAPVSLPR
jgi:hypothetical protein